MGRTKKNSKEATEDRGIRRSENKKTRRRRNKDLSTKINRDEDYNDTEGPYFEEDFEKFSNKRKK
jgi:hypothetical protein